MAAGDDAGGKAGFQTGQRGATKGDDPIEGPNHESNDDQAEGSGLQAGEELRTHPKAQGIHEQKHEDRRDQARYGVRDVEAQLCDDGDQHPCQERPGGGAQGDSAKAEPAKRIAKGEGEQEEHERLLVQQLEEAVEAAFDDRLEDFERRTAGALAPGFGSLRRGGRSRLGQRTAGTERRDEYYNDEQSRVRSSRRFQTASFYQSGPPSSTSAITLAEIVSQSVCQAGQSRHG